MFKQRLRKNNNPEACAQLRILKYCKACGYVAGKIKVKGSLSHGRFIYDPYTFRGMPDLIIFTPKIHFCEVKALTGKQSLEQKVFQGLCEAAGIPYILAYDIKDLQKAGL